MNALTYWAHVSHFICDRTPNRDFETALSDGLSEVRPGVQEKQIESKKEKPAPACEQYNKGFFLPDLPAVSRSSTVGISSPVTPSAHHQVVRTPDVILYMPFCLISTTMPMTSPGNPT